MDSSAYVETTMRANLARIISKSAMRVPNCRRCVAWSIASRIMRREPPMQPAPSDVRPVLRTSTAIRNPWPRSPITRSTGTRTFSSWIGTVDDPFRPSFFSSGPGTTPPRSFVTAKAVMPRCASAAPSATSRAKTVKKPANPPLEIQCFVPFRTKTPAASSSTAVVRIDAASEPASGSVSANAAIISPDASAGSHRFFCSSLPWRSSAFMPIDWWPPIRMPSEASIVPISSVIRQYAVDENP